MADTNLRNCGIAIGMPNSSWNSTSLDLKNISWIHVVLPIVCIVGISGNLLNLVVLTRKRLSGPMQTLERSANIGLTGLALSDLLFNIVALPYPFLTSFHSHVLPRFAGVLYYKYYSIACFNLCLMISMYLVMLLAVERYLVTYRPQTAKKIMHPGVTTGLVVIIYLLCGCATMPYFINMQVLPCITDDGEELYKLIQRWSSSQHYILTAYMTWFWPCIAVFGPLCVLLVCNLRLVTSLRSVMVQSRPSAQKVHSSRVTLLLIIIVFMAIVLVTPAEVLKLINPYKTWGDIGYLIASISNVLQAINFAFNFMLYCAVDRRFRIIVKELFTFGCCKKSQKHNDVIAIPMRHEVPKTSNRTLTLRLYKTNTKTSLLKKKYICS